VNSWGPPTVDYATVSIGVMFLGLVFMPIFAFIFHLGELYYDAPAVMYSSECCIDWSASI